MACILWNDELNPAGCIDIDRNSQLTTIGRKSFSGENQLIPRELISFARVFRSWQLAKVCSYDYIHIYAYVDRRWQRVETAPIALDDNVMIQIWIDHYVIKLIFLDDQTCQDASIIGYMWKSELWRMPINPAEFSPTLAEYSPNTIKEKGEPESSQPTVDLRIQKNLEWLAEYLNRHTWAGIASILIFFFTVFGIWYLQSGKLQLPSTIEHKDPN